MSRRLWGLKSTVLAIAAMALLAGMSVGGAGMAVAQDAPAEAETEAVPVPIPNPLRIPYEPPAPAAEIASPSAGGPAEAVPERIEIPTVDAEGNPLPAERFTLIPVLVDGGAPVADGVVWRIFDEVDDLPANLVADLEGGTTEVELTPGRYFLHAMFGWASTTTEFIVTPDNTSLTVVLNAGGLRLRALIGDDQPLPAAQLRFEVYGVDPTAGERVLITDTAAPDEILRLSAGRYNVVSYYGDINAVVRADIDVGAGELTELALYHEAAQVTLKLVNQRGGEAIANTEWRVLSADGTLLFNSAGAFPSVVLAAGDYIAVAQHNDLVYQTTFAVASGANRDIEVLTDNPAPLAVP